MWTKIKKGSWSWWWQTLCKDPAQRSQRSSLLLGAAVVVDVIFWAWISYKGLEALGLI